MAGSRLPRRVRGGDRVAVGVGSRGIANLQTDGARDPRRAARSGRSSRSSSPPWAATAAPPPRGSANCSPSMASARRPCGVPVKTDMTTVQIGTNSWGEPVYWDKNALAGRRRRHRLARQAAHRFSRHVRERHRQDAGHRPGQARRGGAASSLGRPRPARHAAGDGQGDSGEDAVPRRPGRPRKRPRADGPSAGGRTATSCSTSSPGCWTRRAASWAGCRSSSSTCSSSARSARTTRGAGIDPNVVGRLLIEGRARLRSPKITRICCLDLSPESHGNGTGVGIADLTTERLLAAIDPVPFRMNNLTACFLWRSKLPFAFPDRSRVHRGPASQTCWQPNGDALRLAIIPNTLELAELWVSRSAAGRVRTTSPPGADRQPPTVAVPGEGEPAAKSPLSSLRPRPGETTPLSSEARG